MRRAVMLCLLCLTILPACGKMKVQPISEKEYYEFCNTQANFNCTDACGAVGAALNGQYASALECRKACDKAAADFQLQNSMDQCSGSIAVARDFCNQYCDGKYPKAK